MADFGEGDASPLDGDFRELPSVGFAGELLRPDFDVRHNLFSFPTFRVNEHPVAPISDPTGEPVGQMAML